jgi:hypothetical protein
MARLLDVRLQAWKVALYGSPSRWIGMPPATPLPLCRTLPPHPPNACTAAIFDYQGLDS